MHIHLVNWLMKVEISLKLIPLIQVFKYKLIQNENIQNYRVNDANYMNYQEQQDNCKRKLLWKLHNDITSNELL